MIKFQRQANFRDINKLCQYADKLKCKETLETYLEVLFYKCRISKSNIEKLYDGVWYKLRDE